MTPNNLRRKSKFQISVKKCKIDFQYKFVGEHFGKLWAELTWSSGYVEETHFRDDVSLNPSIQILHMSLENL